MLVLIGFYRKLTSGFGKTSELLYQLLKMEKKLLWTKECENALQELKADFLSATILDHRSNCDEYTLITDASLSGIGAISNQKQEGVHRVFTYSGQTLTKYPGNYSTTKREIFAVMHFNQSTPDLPTGSEVCNFHTPLCIGVPRKFQKS